jgi:hypothetical protein
VKGHNEHRAKHQQSDYRTGSCSAAGTAVYYKHWLALGVAVDAVSDSMHVTDLQHALVIRLNGRVHSSICELVLSFCALCFTGRRVCLQACTSNYSCGNNSTYFRKVASGTFVVLGLIPTAAGKPAPHREKGDSASGNL